MRRPAGAMRFVAQVLLVLVLFAVVFLFVPNVWMVYGLGLPWSLAALGAAKVGASAATIVVLLALAVVANAVICVAAYRTGRGLVTRVRYRRTWSHRAPRHRR